MPLLYSWHSQRYALAEFPEAGPDTLSLIISEYSQLVDLLFVFGGGGFLSSRPQIPFFPRSPLPGLFAVYIPGTFYSKLQQQKATFHLLFLLLLFVILSAKLSVQNVPYFESSENKRTRLSICICSVIISGHVSSVLVELVMQQQHEPGVQGAEQPVKTIPSASS